MSENEQKQESAKLVPESDLMAVKARFEKELKEMQSKLAEVSQKADMHYQSLLQEQTAKEKLLGELNELKSQLEYLKGVDEEKNKLSAKLEELNKQLLSVSAKRLAQVYKIPEEKLAGKTLSELNAIEEALKLVGRDSARFDTGTIDTTSRKLSAYELIRQGLER